VDASLRPTEEIDAKGVFRDMVVVQRRAMVKGGRFLLSTYAALDFSDNPYTMYGFQVNPGYAISDFFEVYINYAPYFRTSERRIVKELTALGVAVETSKPKRQIGAEVLWAPLYGKDSVGSRRVLRSDTFFKFGVMQIKYDIGSGMKFHFAVGKTFFFNKYLGIRPVISENYVQTVRNGVKKYSFFAIVETGLVGYF